MPDILSVFQKRGTFIFGITLAATVIALVISLLVPKEYAATVTALPANSLTADRGRIFNKQVEQLYSDLGTADELDKIEGTGALDTIYIAAASTFNLDQHYGIASSGESLFKAARRLKKHTDVSKTAYGEVQIKVWDEDRNLAATLANFLFDEIQHLHQQVQNANNRQVLQQIQKDDSLKRIAYLNITDSANHLSGGRAEILQVQKAGLLQQLQEDGQLIREYQLAINSNPPVLVPVEKARPPLWYDKPQVLAIVLFTLFGSFLFSFLLALYFESKDSYHEGSGQ